jgi:hypothetical protein
MGIKTEDNKIFKVISEKKKHKFFIGKNKINTKENFSWKVKINKITGWMAFGLGEKKKIENNQYKFSGFNKDNHGCFLISSNKYIWNSNFIQQNNYFLERFSSFKNGEELYFSYSSYENLLRFNYQGNEGVLKNVLLSEEELFPVFILISKNDEIEINY